jgi:hypothetical protein
MECPFFEMLIVFFSPRYPAGIKVPTGYQEELKQEKEINK